MALLTDHERAQRIAELRFCLAELRNRQLSDSRRAWLWRLKEHAAQQALVMLSRSAANVEILELSHLDEVELRQRHVLLQDQRIPASVTPPRWRLELQDHVRGVLGQFLAQRTHSHQTN